MEIIIIKCPICDSEKTSVKKQLDFDLLLKCDKCGFEFESSKGNISKHNNII